MFDFIKEVAHMVEMLDKSPVLRRLAWGALVVCALYALPALVTSIRWW